MERRGVRALTATTTAWTPSLCQSELRNNKSQATLPAAVSGVTGRTAEACVASLWPSATTVIGGRSRFAGAASGATVWLSAVAVAEAGIARAGGFASANPSRPLV